jgi:hypothetical protein
LAGQLAATIGCERALGVIQAWLFGSPTSGSVVIVNCAGIIFATGVLVLHFHNYGNVFQELGSGSVTNRENQPRKNSQMVNLYGSQARQFVMN